MSAHPTILLVDNEPAIRGFLAPFLGVMVSTLLSNLMEKRP